MEQNLNNDVPVITIDGPTASGKGTICRMLAARLNWDFLDSGALYRLVALSAIKQNIMLDNEQLLTDNARSMDVKFESAFDIQQEAVIYLDGKIVTDELRKEQCGNAASKIAVYPGVRHALLERQRAFRKKPGLVADGRDMGTIVFTDAKLKIFLTASAEERAKRRYKQLNDKGINVNLGDLFAEIQQRDKRDFKRTTAPLVPAADAHQLDSTNMSPTDVVEHVIQLYTSVVSD